MAVTVSEAQRQKAKEKAIDFSESEYCLYGDDAECRHFHP